MVYVATPHRQHRAVAWPRSGRQAGPVEKALTVTSPGPRESSRPRETGVFAMEAMWTRFLPTSSGFAS